MPTIQELLEKSRHELLDLSTRNRLLSIPVSSRSACIIQVHDELSEEVYRLLVSEKKSFGFVPGRGTKVSVAEVPPPDAEEDDDEIGLPQPDDEEDSSTGLAKRHVDSRLQTALSPEGLQRRLLDLYRDARTMVEEQGVNILYLVLGHLKWFEAEQADTPRYAPLILVPVELSRKTASERFVLRWTEDEIEENLSLNAKLKADFGIEMPPFPDDEKFSATKYFDAVAQAITRAKNWEVIPNAMTLGFFSFAKFLMYRDLDPENWPEAEALINQPFITGLLQDGYWNFLPPDELDELLRLYSRVAHKTLRISKVFGIEGKKLLRPEDDFDALRDFLSNYEGTTTPTEKMQLELERLLKEHAGLEERLDALPGRVFSGKEHHQKNAQAVFFCYNLPAADATTLEWTDTAGRTAWYLFDFGTSKILDQPEDIHAFIKCAPDTPRRVEMTAEALRTVRLKIETHIKNTYMKQMQAPVGVRPTLKCWMELN